VLGANDEIEPMGHLKIDGGLLVQLGFIELFLQSFCQDSVTQCIDASAVLLLFYFDVFGRVLVQVLCINPRMLLTDVV